jgi:hypothetical protein
MTRSDLKEAVLKALENQGGAARLVDICKFVWENHEGQLRASGDLFYTWQYDVRWAGTALRHEGLLKDSKLSDRGVWELTSPNS